MPFSTTTMQEVKSPKNPPETIIDKTPKTPFTSPLQKFIAQNCEQCLWYKGKCRLEDQNGMKRMELCIMLYVNQPPPDIGDLIAKARQTQKIAEKTMQEAEIE